MFKNKPFVVPRPLEMAYFFRFYIVGTYVSSLFYYRSYVRGGWLGGGLLTPRFLLLMSSSTVSTRRAG